jgi:flagellar hook-basal body complex protein FliE
LSLTPAGLSTAASFQTALGLQAPVRGAVQTESQNFQQFLAGAIQQTNQLALDAEGMTKKLAVGEVSDLHQVMIAMEKSSLALQMTMQVRNKIVDAYQEIMRMQM